METETTATSTKRPLFVRGFYMLIFFMLGSLATTFIAGIACFQFLCVLITGSVNQNLQQFGQTLSQYCYQIAQFLMYNSEEKPYPFGAWPIRKNSL